MVFFPSYSLSEIVNCSINVLIGRERKKSFIFSSRENPEIDAISKLHAIFDIDQLFFCFWHKTVKLNNFILWARASFETLLMLLLLIVII